MLGQLLLGHLVGDYFLQNHWMAVNKVKSGWIGWIAVTIHTLLYTLSICLFTWNFDWYWIVAVFLSHIFIDKYSLGKWFMNLKYKGPPFPTEKDSMHHVALYWIIYIAIDNGAHILLMYFTYQLLYII